MNLLKRMAKAGVAPKIAPPKPTAKTPEQVRASLDYAMKCLKCGYSWRQLAPMPTCPLCDHKYVEWISYAEDMKKLDQAP